MLRLKQIPIPFGRMGFGFICLIFVLLVCSSLDLTGQKRFVGVKFQMNRSGAYSDDLYNDHEYISRFGGGIMFEQYVNKHFSMGAELIYNPLGYSDLVEAKDENGNDVTGTFPVYYHFNYISLPMKLSVLFDQGFIFYSGIDLIPSFLINANYSVGDDFPVKSLAGHNYNITSEVRKLNLAVSPQIGVGFHLGKKNLLCFSAGYYLGLTNNFKDYLKNQGFSFSLALKREWSSN